MATIYLHPALASKPFHVRSLENRTHRTAVCDAKGKVIKLITSVPACNDDNEPRPAA
ncbi:hypothetical protein [Neptunomonas phycophila]|uniref:hypothetical protein n=1 Tax=Neptunomonas phycophila TaxID=1572645 RepID=UPI003736CDCE